LETKRTPLLETLVLNVARLYLIPSDQR
jgi:hypothetical protein